ncbi:hypothetical protein [Polaribacter sp. R77954]|uniref:hypothetical protein n=1 Tax=Polaribacter sp. R77954 TaxID=3093870 RepID=UPI0037C7F005
MLRKYLLFLLLCIGFSIQSQTISTDFRKKIIKVQQDTIQLDSVAINSQKFKVLDIRNIEIASAEYQVDFSKALLIINSKKHKKITVEYFRFPDFITKTYSPFDDKLILQNNTTGGTLYSLTTNKKAADIQLFEGLKTNGFLVRGLTSGNNQNAVTNSSLDLEISGKLSKNVTLRANIFDTNIPIQDNGISQNLTDFDRIFIEMYTDNWRVKAGDLSLKNNETIFFPFAKQVSGLEVEANVNDNLKVAASGAVVRGKFNTYTFTAIEGNQGPYKIYGANNEAVILMIEGAEQVYVNGNQIKRGENEDYTINYNLGEITFNTTFPITNDMRIWIDFQYAERNYTRFITYDKAEYKGEKFNIAGYFYSENDAKNQPLQQSLSTEQQEILVNAGNNQDAMFSESAFLDAFDENKILYKKVNNVNEDYFEYSTNKDDQLYTVTFTNVGTNQGDYVLDDTIAIGNIFAYVGQNQGDYSPVIRLIAPTKSQLFIVKSALNTGKKTVLDAELAMSNRDQNLFSTIDNNKNVALAAKVNWQQTYIDKDWKLSTKVSHEYAQQNFFSEQGYEPVEFNRDWNILTNNATKNFFQSEVNLTNNKEDFVLYRFNNLRYDNSFRGTKHELKSKINTHKTTFFIDGSYLANTSNIEDNFFFRAKIKAEHYLKKSWFGAQINFETNSRKNAITDQFINTSHRFKDYEGYFGIGDSTKIFAKFGINYRNNDSIKSNQFQEINNRKTIYINSKLIQNTTTNLSVFANYRITQNNFTADEKALNSRIIFNQKLFNNFINLNTVYETSSGNVARQDFVYVQTEPGLGFYTWIDYNEDGIKDFNEFEIALFQDQANYLRLPKPNLTFIATQRAKWNQSITINPKIWSQQKGFKKFLSHFYNQSFLSVDNEQERSENSFQLNPFNINDNALISLNLNVRNSLYYNKDLQKHSITFTYGNSQIKQQYFIGNQENNINIHQLDYAHKFADFWLFNVMGKTSKNSLETENLINRNFEINASEIQPKISFLYNKNHRFSTFYHYKNKENQLQDYEILKQQKFGVEYFFIGKTKNQISANVNVFLNDFTGDTNTPVSYQMLEGLQAGTNYTWNCIFNRKLNSFLNLNVSYLGRKSENSRAIHTGSVQLRANF